MYRPQLTALLLAATIPAAAQHTLRGRVLEGESPVGYATTVLLRDGRQAAGTTTDDAGGFVLTADTGRYTLVLRHVAYRPFEQEVCVAAADTDLGDLPLAPLGISEVTVTAEIVRDEKGPKIDILKYKNKTGYKKRQGHRQKYTQVKVTGIEG